MSQAAPVDAEQGRKAFLGLSGRLLERIDIHVGVLVVPYPELSLQRSGGESPAIRERVNRARG